MVSGDAAVNDDVGRAEQLADLVHFVQTIARQVHTAPLVDPEIVELSQLEGLTMQFIDRHPGVRAAELATHLGLKHSNASAALRELDRKGMIRREPDPTDRRAATIWPTELAERNLVRMRAHWARLLSPVPVSDADLSATVATLKSVEAELAHHPAARTL